MSVGVGQGGADGRCDVTRPFLLVEGCEHSLNEEENFHGQLRYDTRRPSVIVRPREAESSRGYVRVFPDQSLQKHLS